MTAVNEDKGGLFFLYGYGGTGKTFIWRTLSSGIRSRDDIVLTMASSGIASLLLSGGRTAHSRFKIPLNLNEDSTCNIKQGSPLALFFLYGYGGTGKTFIWRTLSSGIRSRDDIVLTMASSGIASLLLSGGRTAHSRFKIPLNLNEDSTCNIKQGSPLANLIIKAKLIIWDKAPMMHRFCFEALDQILKDILRFKSASSLDQPFGVLKLKKNMRLQGNHSNVNLDELKNFSGWILAIGDGNIGKSVDDIENVQIPDDLLINHYDDPISMIVENILEKSYLSFDSVFMSDHAFGSLEHVNTLEFVNSICSRVPNHSITLKVGVPVMLLRNIDQSSGLCNRIRLIIARLGNQVIEAKALSGNLVGKKVLIPRMTLTPSKEKVVFLPPILPTKSLLKQLIIQDLHSETLLYSDGSNA
ncbi:uncharacterized protein LOC105632401 [Jatropha curcas]|uniref:uncharacterized protein LOC105632401 n=1 Tax=Jatropha curcas TaxID=180498 RepID=UPI001892FC5E|nr:uncharacterized protein LOC105632401 [Jatropha curcas]